MDQISEHNNSFKRKMHSYDQMRKLNVNLVNKKCEKNNNYTCQLIILPNSVFMSIVDTPQKIYQILIWKLDMRKVRTYSVKSS